MSRSRRLVIALAINVVLVAAQLAAGLAAHSTGLLSDAGHNLTDVAAVLLSLMAVRWALRPRSAARSFGNDRGTILAALVNAAILGIVTAIIVFEAIRRLVHPQQVDAALVVPVAAAAILANASAALVLRERGRDLNMRTAMAHMAADVLASAVVLIAGAVILATGGTTWYRLDPAASLVVASLIVIEAVRLAKQSTDVLLESTPADIDLSNLQDVIVSVPGVDEVHDLHVWSISAEYRALSAHVVLSGHPTLEQAQDVGVQVRSAVETPFDISHTTFELECERCTEDEMDPCSGDRRHGPMTRVVFPTVNPDATQPRVTDRPEPSRPSGPRRG